MQYSNKKSFLVCTQQDEHCHLFVVHSPLAFLMMNLIARKLKIDSRLIGIALVRNQVGVDLLLRNLGIKHFFADSTLLRQSSFSERLKKGAIKQFDREIKTLFGRKSFNLYTFDSVSGINQLASTHPQRTSIFIFEEGIANMRPFQEQIDDHLIVASKQALFSEWSKKRFFTTGLISPTVDGFFSFSRFAFPDLKATNVFDEEVVKSFAQEETFELLVLIPDHRKLSDGALKNQLSRLVRSKIRTEEGVAVKFHPANTKQEEEYWLDVFHDLQITANVLNSATYIVEANLLAGKICEIVGWGSSLLLYAQEFGVPSTDLDTHAS